MKDIIDYVNGKPSDALVEAFQRAILLQQMHEDDAADADLDTEVSPSDISTSRDPFSRWDGSAWREAEGRVDGMLATGQPFRYWERAQARRGQQRYEVAVADCGDYVLIWQR